MTDAILKLATWLSPGYPVGAFAFSHGLESAIAEGRVSDVDGVRDWVADGLVHGAGRTDAILIAAVMRAGDDDAVAELATLASALAPSKERLLETQTMGAAFAETTSAAWGGTAADPDAANEGGAAAPYPIAFGKAARAHDIAPAPAVTLYLHAFAANLISAAVRLVPLGQTEGQTALAALAPLVEAVADEALNAAIDDIGGCAVIADVASMRHETQDIRLFRS